VSKFHIQNLCTLGSVGNETDHRTTITLVSEAI